MKKAILVQHGSGLCVCRIVVYSDRRTIHYFDDSKVADTFELQLNAGGIMKHDGTRPSADRPFYDRINFVDSTVKDQTAAVEAWDKLKKDFEKTRQAERLLA